MSRCFPFSSSGYARNCSSNQNDALIVSIKLQEQKEISIPDRVKEDVKSSDKKKDRKSEKKDRKKDKKEKKDKKRVEKEQVHSVIESGKQKPDDKLCKADGFEKESKGKRSFEVLERSNLTEEHGRPVDPQNVSCSSDSTGNSSKRKRVSSPPSSIQGNGNIIRIRLSSSKKRDEPSTSCIIPPRKTEDHSKSQANLQPSVISQTNVMAKVQESQANLRPSSVSVPVISQTNVMSKVQESQANLRPSSVSVPVRPPVISQTNVRAKVQESQSNLRPSSVSVPIRPPVIRQTNVMAKVQESQSNLPSSVSVPVIRQTNVIAKVQEPVRVIQETKVEPLASREGPSTSGRVEIREPPSKKVKKLSSHERKMLKKEALYNTLFQNLAPPMLTTEQVGLDDDEDWLFGKKEVQPAKKLRLSDDEQPQACMDNLSCSGSAVLQPRANFLSDVGIYALPFTVPF